MPKKRINKIPIPAKKVPLIKDEYKRVGLIEERNFKKFLYIIF